MTQEARQLLSNLATPLRWVGLLWFIHLFQFFTGYNFAVYGIFPHEIFGLAGILAAPLVHSDLGHLMSNSVPLIVLGWMLLYFYPQSAGRVFINVYIFTGVLVWLFGRPTFHIGASGVIYGLAFFLFFISVMRKDVRSLAIVAILIIFYGGMIWGIFPGDPGISFESHLSGAVVGVVMAWLSRKRDLPPPPPQYFEDEPEEAGYKFIYRPSHEENQPES
jgi:membrane associated rhomboid family serine protease